MLKRRNDDKHIAKSALIKRDSEGGKDSIRAQWPAFPYPDLNEVMPLSESRGDKESMDTDKTKWLGNKRTSALDAIPAKTDAFTDASPVVKERVQLPANSVSEAGAIRLANHVDAVFEAI
jgi:hypothetical protein